MPREWAHVAGDVMLLAILVMGAFSAQAGIAGALDMAPVFAVLFLASLALTGLYFANFRPAGSGDAMPAPQIARRAPGTIEDARRKVGV